MKKYSTKAYYKYAKRMLEGEAALASSAPTGELATTGSTALVPAEKVKPVDSQFKGLILTAGTGAVGALACIKYLDKTFSIQSVDTLAKQVKGMGADIYLNSAPNSTSIQIGKIVKSCTDAISKAIMWIRNKLWFANYQKSGWVGKQAKLLGQTIGNSGYTYGTVLAIATAGALMGAILYKVYRIIKKMISSKNTTESYYKVQISKMKKTINESLVLIKKLSSLTEGDSGADNSVATSEAIINKNESVIDEMWNWATKTPFHTLAVLFIPVVSWIIALIAICKACVVCWRGLKGMFDKESATAVTEA